jgi:hypothetical protein
MKKIFLFFGILLYAYQAKSQQSQTFADCNGAIILCEMKDFVVKELSDAGKEKYEVGHTSCSQNLRETHSAWIKWEIAKSGKFHFLIEPLQQSDDIDFVLYRLDGGFANCSNKQEIRCMSTGLSLGRSIEDNYPCRGNTGLNEAVSDKSEGDGCSDAHDNYLGSIAVRKGEQYLLFVNNYGSKNGFKVLFDGTTSFKMPEIDIIQTDNSLEANELVLFQHEKLKHGLDMDDTPLNMAKKIQFVNEDNTHISLGCNLETVQERTNTSNIEMKGDGSAYPNPCQDYTNLKFTSLWPSIMIVEVFDVYGRLLSIQKYVVEQGEQVLQIALDKLPFGSLGIRYHLNGVSNTVVVLRMQSN